MVRKKKKKKKKKNKRRHRITVGQNLDSKYVRDAYGRKIMTRSNADTQNRPSLFNVISMGQVPSLELGVTSSGLDASIGTAV